MTRYMVFLVLILVLTPATASAQDATGGIVRINNPDRDQSLNPLLCNTAVCGELADLLFPSLFATDYATGTLVRDRIGAAMTDRALVRSWDASADGLTYTLFLRDDAHWSDGTQITAYDVFFAYLLAINNPASPVFSRLAKVQALLPMDATTVVVTFSQADCAALNALDFPVLPSHVFNADFAVNLPTFSLGMDYVAQFERYQDNNALNLSYVREHPFNNTLSVTYGMFSVTDIRENQFIRLRQGDLALEYVSNIGQSAAVERFLNGQLNLLLNPPFDQRRNLEILPGVQVYTYPSATWDYIALNLANPRDPQPAYDKNTDRDTENGRIDQGNHPIFGSLEVRRALQLAIDVETIIETAVYGYGQPIASASSPASWAHNADLTPLSYDPAEAARILEAAGWRALTPNSARTCIACESAPDGSRLSFTLLYDTSAGRQRDITVDLLKQQLISVGVDIAPVALSPGELLSEVSNQRFDAYLTSSSHAYPIEPRLSQLFASSADILIDPNTTTNHTSYYNPQVDDLLARADTLPGCDYAQRAELYHQAQAVLQQDQAYLWLYTPERMIVASGEIMGFQPLPYMAFASADEWIINPDRRDR
jgi:peptide/nickel transport system substrate-binding protein